MSATSPRVSVVVPTWNGERYIGDTLASVFAQTFSDFELIVVDDGSTDRTRATLEPLRSQLRYVYQDRAGQSAARNRGAQLARGEYLAFLDHDDCWEPSYLEQTVGYLAAHPPVGLVAPAVRFLTAAGQPTPRVLHKRSPGVEYTTCSLLEGDVGTIRNPVMRRTVFVEAGGYDTTICGPEDCDLWLSLSFLTTLHHLPLPLLLYRSHPNNYSKNYLDNARQWLRLLDKFEELHPEFAAAHRRLLRIARAKQYLRLGRELLASARDRQTLAAARAALTRSIRHAPSRPKAYLYAGLTLLPGAGLAYSRWRRRELELRERLLGSRVLGRLAAWQRRPSAGGTHEP